MGEERKQGRREKLLKRSSGWVVAKFCPRLLGEGDQGGGCGGVEGHSAASGSMTCVAEIAAANPARQAEGTVPPASFINGGTELESLA